MADLAPPNPNEPAPPPRKRRWLPRLQFSLRTLLIFVLLDGSAGGLWWRWAPWELTFTIRSSFSCIGRTELSPDGRFLICGDYDNNQLEVWEVQGRRKIFQKALEGRLWIRSWPYDEWLWFHGPIHCNRYNCVSEGFYYLLPL